MTSTAFSVGRLMTIDVEDNKPRSVKDVRSPISGEKLNAAKVIATNPNKRNAVTPKNIIMYNRIPPEEAVPRIAILIGGQRKYLCVRR